MNKFLGYLLIVAICFLPVVTRAVGTAALLDPKSMLIGSFGGKVVSWKVCECSGSVLITLMDFKTLKPIDVIYVPFLSRLNELFNFFIPGNAILGTYFGAGAITSAYTSSVLGGAQGPLTSAQSVANPAICATDWPVCHPYGNPVGIITPYPFSGVGTSLIPIIPIKILP